MNDLKYLIDNFNQVSSSMSILKEHMYQGVKVGNDIRNMLDKMAFDVERAKAAFITADNQESTLFRGDDGVIVFKQVGFTGGTLDSLYRGETAAEKLDKYKSINIVKTKDTISNKFWSLWDSIMNDKTPLLARLGIGEIPSSSDIVSSMLIKSFGNKNIFNSDIFDSMLSGVGVSLSGTVVGHTNSILKQSIGCIERMRINNDSIF